MPLQKLSPIGDNVSIQILYYITLYYIYIITNNRIEYIIYILNYTNLKDKQYIIDSITLRHNTNNKQGTTNGTVNSTTIRTNPCTTNSTYKRDNKRDKIGIRIITRSINKPEHAFTKLYIKDVDIVTIDIHNFIKHVRNDKLFKLNNINDIDIP